VQNEFVINSEVQQLEIESHLVAKSPLRVLYLTCFEQPVHSGIFESQVKGYLCRLAGQKREEIKLSQLAFRPAALIGRDGLSFPFVGERTWFRALKQEFARYEIDADVAFVPVVLPRRWSFYFNLPILAAVVALTVPILLFKVARGRYQIIHCRSYVSTLCALLVRSLLKNFKVVFDMRGFYPEEGLIHRTWKPNSLTFNVWKRLERFLTQNADHTIALCDAFKDRVTQSSGRDTCSLVYAGTDVRRFREATQFRTQIRSELGFEDKIVFAYSGGLGSWHDPAMLAKVGAALHRNIPNSALLILTPYDKRVLEAEFLRAGLEAERVRIMALAPGDVPRYLCAADFGLVPLRAMNGSDPGNVVADTMVGLKVAEYMAAGLPVIANDRVGGLRSLMSSFKIGVGFDSEDLETIIPKVQNMIGEYGLYQQSCRLVSEKLLSLDVAVGSCYDVYHRVLDCDRVR
jgi:glycosyltransferase involved in cell wall biosynthesis